MTEAQVTEAQVTEAQVTEAQVTEQALQAVWRDLARRAGIGAPEAGAIFQDLCGRYSEPGRAYHNLDHIAAVLEAVSDAGWTGDGIALRLAVWFHDAVYDTRRGDNEEQSADYAAAALGGAGLSPDVLTSVGRLILATKTHTSAPDDPDARLLLDADLAVLGASPAEYDRYAGAIREEYAWVPDADYRAGRGRVLSGFLSREHLYQTARVRRAWEQAARDNLRREIDRLTP